MKKIDVGQTLQILGNIGVLIGILLLVYELNQNREMMRAQVRNEVASQTMTFFSNVVADEGLADILTRGGEVSNLDAGEVLRHRFHVMTQIRLWENTHYQYRIGLFDAEEFTGIRETWSTVANRSMGFQRVWCYFRPQTSREFRTELDSIINDLDCQE